MQINLEHPGTIDPNLLYSLEAFKRATGWTAAAVRQARRDGMPVRYVGRQCWVLGRDFIEHVTTRGKTEKDGVAQ